MGEPGHRQLNNGQPGAHNYGHPHLQQAQYQGVGHPPQPRRSSIQSMLNPPSPDPAAPYGYYPNHHGAHAPQHHVQHPHQHQHPQQQQQQQPYMHPIKQPATQQQPPQPSQHHHQLPQHRQEQYHQDDRQYAQTYQYQQHSHSHPQQQHSRPPPHQHQQQPQSQPQPHQHQLQAHQQQQQQQQPAYYAPHAGLTPTPAPTSKPTNAYPAGPAPLPPISSQSHYRSYSQYSPGSTPNEGAFQAQTSGAFQGPPQTTLHAHHQQGRHVQHDTGAVPGQMGTHVAPGRAGGESADMRMQSPPAGASHFSHMAQGHVGARPPSPRSSQDFGRSRQTSVSNYAVHGDYRQYHQEAGSGPSNEYYQGPYQDAGYAGAHPSARQPDPQQHPKQLQQQQPPHPQQQQQPQHQHQQPQPQPQPQPQQPQQQQHQYASQYPPHAGSGYMRSSAPEVDRTRSHSISAQQQQQQQQQHPEHYVYPPQPAPQVQQPQHGLMSPPPRTSMQDVHSGGARTNISSHQQQHQSHHPQERPQPENDEAEVMNFMSELQMRQQQQQPQQQHQHQLQHNQVQGQPVHKQSRKSASSPQVPQPAPQMATQQMYTQHSQHQHVQHSQPHHAPAIQPQQQQSMHIEHPALPPPHSRYVHNDHHGYPQSHEPLPTSPVYRPQPSSVAPTAAELPPPITPPGLISPGVHPRSQGAMVDARQRPIPGSGIGPDSPGQMTPHSGLQPLEPIKTTLGPGTPTGPAPPRSASLMNILNIPERESRGRHAETDTRGDMEDVQPTSAHVTQSRISVEPSLHQAYHHDLGQRADYLPTFSDTARDSHYEEKFAEPERLTQETPTEPDSNEEHASVPVVAPKAGKEKVARPIKEKVVKEKPVKPIKEKVEKVKKERIPKKKKLSTTATIGMESDEPGMDTAMEHEQPPAELRSQEPRSQEPRPQEPRPQEPRPQEPQPQEARPLEGRSLETQPLEVRSLEARPQEARPQESRPHETRPQETRPQETRPQETRPQELRLQEPRLQDFRPQESHPQESHPQQPRSQEATGVFKHTLELPGGGRIELPSKKPRMETFPPPAPGGDAPVKALRGSDVRRSQESIDRTPVDRGSVQTQPIEPPKATPAIMKDSPAESRIASSKLNSPQQPFPVSLPAAESAKAPRTDDVLPKQASTAKSSSTHARSRSSSPPPGSSSLRGHTGLGVDLPEPHVNGSSGSGKKSHQDGDRDRDRDRTKATTSKEVSKSSKATSGGSSTPKEKKASKKEPVPDRFQDNDVVIPQKASKSSESKKSHDMDEDMPSPKLPSKAQSSSKKNSSSAQSQGSSLKKRFSRPAELEDGHLGSTGSKAQETVQDSTSGHDRTTSSESSRGKPKSHSSSTKVESEQSSSTKTQKSSSSSSTLVAKEEDVELGEQPDRGEGLYCICRTVYDPTRFMIACDGCDDWFHGDCVGVAEKDSDMVDKYYCKRCEEKGRYGSLKKKCSREGCQKSAARKSKYCSKECGLLVATQRIQESQERVFGDESSNQTDLPPGQVVQQQHLQRRRRLTLADLDDRQRLLGIREKMAHVRKVCMILEERAMQLDVCVDRQVRQDLGKLDLSTIAGLIASSSPTAGSAGGNNGEGKPSGGVVDMEDEDEGVLRTGPSQSKSKAKAKTQKDRATAKDKDKDALCGFDHSLVWDDAQDIARKDRAALSSLVSTPVGSRASSIAPPSFGVVVVNPKKLHNGSAVESGDSKMRADGNQDGEGGVGGGAQASSSTSGDAATGVNALTSSPYLEAVGRRVCMNRRNCDRHNGWQKLKASELELEQTTQNKLLKSLKAEAKLVKSRMKRRRNDLSARILNGTIEH